jgi:hypothetical protein
VAPATAPPTAIGPPTVRVPATAAAARALPVVRAVYGVGLLVAPAAWLSAASGEPLDGAAVVVARVLGTRQLVQAGLTGRYPTPRRRLIGAGVDAAHAASMLAVARWSPRPSHRRLALRQARTAGLFALWGAVRSHPGY